MAFIWPVTFVILTSYTGLLNINLFLPNHFKFGHVYIGSLAYISNKFRIITNKEKEAKRNKV